MVFSPQERASSPKTNLDFLRAIAVTLVVIDHITLSQRRLMLGRWHVEDIGVLGVYFFFVHTSLVLMWSLERRPNVLDFYVRRIFRIYPLAVLAILLAAFTHAPVGGTVHDYFAAMPFSRWLLLSNCLLITDLIVRHHTRYILGVIWSLGPEVFMYVLLPALFAYARFTRRVWPLLGVWLLVVLYTHSLIVGAPFGNGFMVLIPDFIAGIIAYVGFMRVKPRWPAWTFLPFLAVLFAIFMSRHYTRIDWLITMALGLALPYFRQFEKEALTRLCHKVATYSYGIYLLHPFAIVLGMYVLRAEPFWLQLVVMLSSLAVGSFLSYHVIEKPMIDFGARLAARWAHERRLPSEASLENLEPAP